MLSKFLVPALLLVSLHLSSFAGKAFAADDGLSDAQKKEVEKVVQDYIVKNPEILIHAMQQYRIAQQNAEREQARNNLISLTADLNVNPASPVIGNPDGDVTVVELFDYRCGYCKKV
ncbi:MAG: DsbA family protein, partial [Rhodospirillales bacterium]|nr:DsbA family protein [Rhodospirillales bacterium]